MKGVVRVRAVRLKEIMFDCNSFFNGNNNARVLSGHQCSLVAILMMLKRHFTLLNVSSPTVKWRANQR